MRLASSHLTGTVWSPVPPAPSSGRVAEEGPPPIRDYRGDKAILDQLDVDSGSHSPAHAHC